MMNIEIILKIKKELEKEREDRKMGQCGVIVQIIQNKLLSNKYEGLCWKDSDGCKYTISDLRMANTAVCEFLKFNTLRKSLFGRRMLNEMSPFDVSVKYDKWLDIIDLKYGKKVGLNVLGEGLICFPKNNVKILEVYENVK